MKKRVITVNGVRILEGKDRAMRDPRKDPRPGDVVIYGPQWQLERVDVTNRPTEDSVEYRQLGKLWIMMLPVWLDYMAGAEVLHVAD